MVLDKMAERRRANMAKKVTFLQHNGGEMRSQHSPIPSMNPERNDAAQRIQVVDLSATLLNLDTICAWLGDFINIDTEIFDFDGAKGAQGGHARRRQARQDRGAVRRVRVEVPVGDRVLLVQEAVPVGGAQAGAIAAPDHGATRLMNSSLPPLKSWLSLDEVGRWPAESCRRLTWRAFLCPLLMTQTGDYDAVRQAVLKAIKYLAHNAFIAWTEGAQLEAATFASSMDPEYALELFSEEMQRLALSVTSNELMERTTWQSESTRHRPTAKDTASTASAWWPAACCSTPTPTSRLTPPPIPAPHTTASTFCTRVLSGARAQRLGRAAQGEPRHRAGRAAALRAVLRRLHLRRASATPRGTHLDEQGKGRFLANVERHGFDESGRGAQRRRGRRRLDVRLRWTGFSALDCRDALRRNEAVLAVVRF